MERAIRNKTAQLISRGNGGFSSDEDSQSSGSVKMDIRPVPRINASSRGKAENAFDDEINNLQVIDIVNTEKLPPEIKPNAEIECVNRVEGTEIKPEPFLDLKAKKKRLEEFRSKSFEVLRFDDWTTSNDYALLLNLEQLGSIEKVHIDVKFSKNFTVNELRSRFYAILYNNKVFSTVRRRVRNMHPLEREYVEKNVHFSSNEDEYLSTIASTEQPSLLEFEDLLLDYEHIFHYSRTAKALQKRWNFLKAFNLLIDQSFTDSDLEFAIGFDHEIRNVKTNNSNKDFNSDDSLDGIEYVEAEDETAGGAGADGDTEVAPQRSEEEKKQDSEIKIKAITKKFYKQLLNEDFLRDYSNNRKTRLLDAELLRWRTVVNSLEMVDNYIGLPTFDINCYAALRGRYVCFYIYRKSVSFGRRTESSPDVHIDLQKEAFAEKVSRFQGMIDMDDSYDFSITNFGRRAILVNDQVCLSGEQLPLHNSNVVIISNLAFIFIINDIVINKKRKESMMRMEVESFVDEPYVEDSMNL